MMKPHLYFSFILSYLVIMHQNLITQVDVRLGLDENSDTLWLVRLDCGCDWALTVLRNRTNMMICQIIVAISSNEAPNPVD